MTNSTISYILGSDSVTVYVSSKPYCINKQAHNYDLVIKAIQSGDITKVEAAVNTKQTIINKLQGKSGVRIEGNQIFFGDRLIEGLISSRIFEMIGLGLDVQPMVNFLDNMLQNPSKRAVDELFGFMEACTLPITPDGHFLAYKRIREDYKDCHSGTMDNSVGNVLEMPRNEVDEDKDRTCSSGLHFCSYDYLSSFSGDRVVVLKINPKDVVAIPSDYNNSKGRTCRYEVVEEITLQYKGGLPTETLPIGATVQFGHQHCDCEDLEDDEKEWEKAVLIEIEQVKSAIAATENGCKLSPNDVKYIRTNSTLSTQQLADDFGVSPRTIRRVRSGESYKDVV